MKLKYSLFIIVLLASFSGMSQDMKQDSATMKKISNHILSNYRCYNDLRYLCKHIGHRISGSPQAEQAVNWGKEVLEKIGCDRVFLQEVIKPPITIAQIIKR